MYRLPKPDKEITSERLTQVIDAAAKDPKFSSYIEAVNKPVYLYWDKARYKRRPKGLLPEEFWALIKLLRRYSTARVATPVRTEDKKIFSWQPLPDTAALLHQIDMQLGGKLESAFMDDGANRQRFISRGIMEEAIASSQLEGANTTRKAAKRMILEKREPSNKSDRMILNNYDAMVMVEERLRHEKLTMRTILDLHATLTRETIDPGDVGRVRRDRDEVVVADVASGETYHIPPSEKFLKSELKKLVAYANDEATDSQFVHPVIKAIILHFWIAFLHPFTDGNGRLARTLFYWYLLRHQYWAFTYLPLSRVIKKSPVQYRDAYVYSEQDENDLTYFIDYNLRKIEQAKREFENYVKRKERENRRMTQVGRAKYGMNDRQIQLLRFLHKDPSSTTTIRAHARVYGLSRLTAAKDLHGLEDMGFLESHRVGRELPFSATSKVSELF